MKLASVLVSVGYLSVTLDAAAADDNRRFSRVALLLPACEEPGLGASELRRAFALDLRDEGLSLAPVGELAPESDVLMSVASDCSGSGRLLLQADFASERSSRRLELSEIPAAQRGRAVSLALAELLARMGRASPPSEVPAEAPATATEASVAPASPRPPPRAPTPNPPSTSSSSSASRSSASRADERALPPSTPAPRRWQLSLAPELRAFRTTRLAGGRALVRYARFSVGIDLLTAHTSSATGSVRTLTPHAVCAYALPIAGAPDRGLFEVGPRLGAGRSFMYASASPIGRATSAADVYLDVAATARYSLRVASRWRVGLTAELGYAGGPIGYAGDQEIARTSGVFAGVLGDVAWQL